VASMINAAFNPRTLFAPMVDAEHGNLLAHVAAGQRRYAVRFLAKRGGTPQLVYGVVYKGLGALAGDSPVLRLSCKWWKQES
jgi:hypothetical protein